jgi:hypothetical protein
MPMWEDSVSGGFSDIDLGEELIIFEPRQTGSLLNRCEVVSLSQAERKALEHLRVEIGAVAGPNIETARRGRQAHPRRMLRRQLRILSAAKRRSRKCRSGWALQVY